MDWRESSYHHRRSRRHLKHRVSEQVIERAVLSKGQYLDRLAMEALLQQAVKRFPHQLYYKVFHDRIELCRVLHLKRDITQAMLSRQRSQ